MLWIVGASLNGTAVMKTVPAVDTAPSARTKIRWSCQSRHSNQRTLLEAVHRGILRIDGRALPGVECIKSILHLPTPIDPR